MISSSWPAHQQQLLYSNVMILVRRYSFSAPYPRSLPNPDCLNPPSQSEVKLMTIYNGFFLLIPPPPSTIIILECDGLGPEILVHCLLSQILAESRLFEPSERGSNVRLVVRVDKASPCLKFLADIQRLVDV